MSCCALLSLPLIESVPRCVILKTLSSNSFCVYNPATKFLYIISLSDSRCTFRCQLENTPISAFINNYEVMILFDNFKLGFGNLSSNIKLFDLHAQISDRSPRLIEAQFVTNRYLLIRTDHHLFLFNIAEIAATGPLLLGSIILSEKPSSFFIHSDILYLAFEKYLLLYDITKSLKDPLTKFDQNIGCVKGFIAINNDFVFYIRICIDSIEYLQLRSSHLVCQSTRKIPGGISIDKETISVILSKSLDLVLYPKESNLRILFRFPTLDSERLISNHTVSVITAQEISFSRFAGSVVQHSNGNICLEIYNNFTNIEAFVTGRINTLFEQLREHMRSFYSGLSDI